MLNSDFGKTNVLVRPLVQMGIPHLPCTATSATGPDWARRIFLISLSHDQSRTSINSCRVLMSSSVGFRTVRPLLRTRWRPIVRQSATTTIRHRRWIQSVSAADLKFGQPLHETHPHLLEPGERKVPYLKILDVIVCSEFDYSYARDSSP